MSNCVSIALELNIVRFTGLDIVGAAMACTARSSFMLYLGTQAMIWLCSLSVEDAHHLLSASQLYMRCPEVVEGQAGDRLSCN